MQALFIDGPLLGKMVEVNRITNTKVDQLPNIIGMDKMMPAGKMSVVYRLENQQKGLGFYALVESGMSLNP